MAQRQGTTKQLDAGPDGVTAAPRPASTRFTSTSEPVRPRTRLLAVGATWLLLLVATPGFAMPDGSLTLAFLALVPWALVASRPGPRAFWVEWLAAAVGLSAQVYWNVNVLWITLLAVAIVPGAYMACAGVVLRRIAPHFPLAIAAPVAWIGLETLNGVVEPPFGFGWMRFGHHAHQQDLLLGAMRVVGVGGVGFALAAYAGLIADALRARAERRPLGRAPIAFAAACAGVIVLSSLATAPPATTAGPRIVLVQPDFKAVRKQKRADPRVDFDELAVLTQRGLDEAARGGRPADVVAWGETVYPWAIAAPDLDEAHARGARIAPWGQHEIGPTQIGNLQANEEYGIARSLYGVGNRGRRLIPAGTTFLTGVEEYVERDGMIRRANSIVVYGEDGVRIGRGGKIHLVPGGESLAGLERIAWIRDTAFELAGYVPDLVGDERTSVVAIPLRDAPDGSKRTAVQVGLTVCFDNTYDGPYTEPLRRGKLDLHLIASNEAWYVETWEFDQMLAFSRCIAAATGRSMVRATNSGVSIVIGPDGRDVARLVGAGGKDRNAPGVLVADVPVPVGDPGPTVYARIEPFLRALWIVLPVLLLGLARARRRSPA